MDINNTDVVRSASVDPNEIFAQFGLDTSTSTRQTVTQSVGNITVEAPEPAVVDADFEEVDDRAIAVLDVAENTDIEDIVARTVSVPSESNSTESGLAGTSPSLVIIEERATTEQLNEEMLSMTSAYTSTNSLPAGYVGTPIPLVEENTASEENTEVSLVAEIREMQVVPLIAVNPLSILEDESTSRFSGASWFNAVQESTVILAGLGGIGSYVLFLLSRMKPKQVYIYDDDEVERVNLSGQLYNSDMVGSPKVNAMVELAKSFSDYHGIMAVKSKFTENTPAGDIMICGFDNMDARKCFFKAWKDHLVGKSVEEQKKCLFIDGRLNAEEFQVFCITGDCSYDIERYRNSYLFEDWMAESVQCSYKQTSFCANMIGSVIVNLYTNFIANTLAPVIPRALPFKTYYSAESMYFKTEL